MDTVERSLRYLALADDKEGVSSGALSDDVVSTLIMSLNGQR